MKEFNELVVIFLQVEHLFMCLRCPQLILRVQIKKIWYLKSILLSLEIIFTCWKWVLQVKSNFMTHKLNLQATSFSFTSSENWLNFDDEKKRWRLEVKKGCQIF